VTIGWGARAAAAVLVVVPVAALPAAGAVVSKDPAPGRADEYRAALEAFFAGEEDEAASRFQALAEEGSGHELAREYLAGPSQGSATTEEGPSSSRGRVDEVLPASSSASLTLADSACETVTVLSRASRS
jgi:hypothetical protein